MKICIEKCSQDDLVWEALGFCAAAVIGRKRCNKPSGAGVGRVLAAAHTFKRITALCLFDRQLAMGGTWREGLKGALFFFAHWDKREMKRNICFCIKSVFVYVSDIENYKMTHHTHEQADIPQGFSGPPSGHLHSGALEAGYSWPDRTL